MRMPRAPQLPQASALTTRGSRVTALSDAARSRLGHFLLRLHDLLLTMLSFGLAYIVRYRLEWFMEVEPVHSQAFAVYWPSALTLLLIQPVVFQLAGVYRRRPQDSKLGETFTIASASTLSIVILIIFQLFFNPLLYSRLVFLYTAGGMTFLIGLSRLVVGHLRRYAHQRGMGNERVLLVGTGEYGRMVMRNIVARPELGWELLGFLHEEDGPDQGDIGRFKMLGPVSRLVRVVEEMQPDRVIICLSWRNYSLVEETLQFCLDREVPAQVVPNLFQVTRRQIKLETLNGVPLLSVQPLALTGWNYLLKRLLDIVLLILVCIPSLVLGALVALAIWIESRGPVFYSQIRVGRNRQPFRVYKFRSMIPGAEEKQAELESLEALDTASDRFFKIKDDPRRTRVGRVLRGFSLDEMPQFLNVLRGEMSFIGPRPALPKEVEKYADWHLKRLAVLPGITGLWQVSGRSDLTFGEMVLLDIYYAENWNLALDLEIALRTIPAVLLRRGAY